MAKRDTRKRFEREVKRLRPSIAKAFENSINDIKDSIALEDLVKALERGDIEGALQVLRTNVPYFIPITESMRNVFIAGGAYTQASIPKRHPLTRAKITFRFGGSHPRAEEWLKGSSGKLIQKLDDDNLKVARLTLAQGLADGRNPRSVALDLVGRVDKLTGKRKGGSIGLHDQYAQAVVNYRRKLVEKGVKQSKINQLVVRKQNKLLKARGDTIARTEAIGALGAGRLEGYKQLVERGTAKAKQIFRKWDATGDSRTRNSHTNMDGQRVAFDEPFVTPSGHRLMFAGDSSLGAPAEEIINCRCYAAVIVDWLMKV